MAPRINTSVTPHLRALFARCSFNEAGGGLLDSRREADARRRRDRLRRAAGRRRDAAAARLGRAARLRRARACAAGLALGGGGGVPRRAGLPPLGLAGRRPAPPPAAA